ncbi:MAG: hypothetical protein LKM36_15985 [Flavobacteriales bacterium]|nr:hypothetical protein [Flavobacteriales bacterium]MCI1754302.1 hypothetical protein [Flavobacteriales bacterium]
MENLLCRGSFTHDDEITDRGKWLKAEHLVQPRPDTRALVPDIAQGFGEFFRTATPGIFFPILELWKGCSARVEFFHVGLIQLVTTLVDAKLRFVDYFVKLVDIRSIPSKFRLRDEGLAFPSNSDSKIMPQQES